ncbi:MAG: efflux RND transporter periplasmic adaptor subunit, partial [Myxococcaceae bacterium]
GFRRRQVEALRVTAGAPGVLQELPLQPGQWVAAGTLLAKVAQPDRLKAEIRIAEAQARDVQAGQAARIDTRQGVVSGHVTRVDPAVQAGAVLVEVAFDAPLPKGCRPDLSVEGTIELERLTGVLYVGRPAFAVAGGGAQLFRLVEGGRGAVKTPVRLGRGSVAAVEILGGLREGDEVILSDMTQFDADERVALK